MKNWILLILLFLSSCSYKTPQKIHSIKLFTEFDFNNIEQEAMVIFDVDQVLIERSCKVFWGKTEKEHGQWLNKLYDEVFKKAKHDPFYYFSIMLSQDTPVIIEPYIADIIGQLQNRGVTVIALTTTNTGSCFTIPSLPIWRFNKLKEVGIDFSTPGITNMEFPELPSKSPEESGKYPVFYNGILYTGDASKGDVLTAFLEHTKLKPTRVIFFDDKRANLESVSQAMHNLGIPFTGYEYLGGSYIPGELDKELASYQLHYLIDHETWLSEDEAKVWLNQSTTRPISCSKAIANYFLVQCSRRHSVQTLSQNGYSLLIYLHI